MDDPPEIPGPPPPRRLAGPGWTPLRSAQGLDLGGAAVVALPSSGRRAGSPQAEAGGQAAAARLCRWGSGSAACRGRGWAGPALNSFEPASRRRPRPLRSLPFEGRGQEAAPFLGSADQQGRKVDPSGSATIRGSPATCTPSQPLPISRFCPPPRRNSVCPLRPEEELHLAL
ncbi:uncharacterized protein ACIGJ3_016074 isoform 1-T1 [Trichechus inunguis]